MLGRRLRRLANLNPALVQCIVFAGMYLDRIITYVPRYLNEAKLDIYDDFKLKITL